MSSFTIKTDDGQELSFLKDNCPIEEGALAGDSGDKVTGDLCEFPGSKLSGGD